MISSGHVKVPSVTNATVRRPGGLRLVRAIGALILAGHGLIHLMGVALFWRLSQPGDLRYTDTHPVPGSLAGLAVGAIWLAAAVLFVTGAILLVAHRRWSRVAVIAIAVSAPILAASASTAAAGLVVDAAVLLAVLATSPRTLRS